MKTIQQVGQTLQDARTAQRLKLDQLVRTTGLTAVTLRGLLTGRTDSRLSTVLALAHELGLELLLVPTAIAKSIVAQSDPSTHTSSVSRAVKRPSEAPHGALEALESEFVPQGRSHSTRTVQSFVERAIAKPAFEDRESLTSKQAKRGKSNK